MCNTLSSARSPWTDEPGRTPGPPILLRASSGHRHLHPRAQFSSPRNRGERSCWNDGHNPSSSTIAAWAEIGRQAKDRRGDSGACTCQARGRLPLRSSRTSVRPPRPVGSLVLVEASGTGLELWCGDLAVVPRLTERNVTGNCTPWLEIQLLRRYSDWYFTTPPDLGIESAESARSRHHRSSCYFSTASNRNRHRCPAGRLEISWSDISMSAAVVSESGVVRNREYTSLSNVFISASARLAPLAPTPSEFAGTR